MTIVPDPALMPRFYVRVDPHNGPLNQAIRAGLARVVMILPSNPKGLVGDWAIPIERDEAVVETTQLRCDELPSFQGIAALVVKRRALPAPQLEDGEAVERVAEALVGELLRNMKP